ncbi:hypothetical protein O3M35_002413 [Rhynocoris fuscipes]|uniref:Uncharacterized protein n=1 Tax=Rhynocoris fuscipes TaxID=488301 RepID=A0AAW1CSX5_9HEMI
MVKTFKGYDYVTLVFIVCILSHYCEQIKGTPFHYGRSLFSKINNPLSHINSDINFEENLLERKQSEEFCEPPKESKPSSCIETENDNDIQDKIYFKDTLNFIDQASGSSKLDKDDTANRDLNNIDGQKTINLTKILSINVGLNDKGDNDDIFVEIIVVFLLIFIAFTALMFLVYAKMSHRRKVIKVPYSYRYANLS